jgi:predicted metal-dependent hydrolase
VQFELLFPPEPVPQRAVSPEKVEPPLVRFWFVRNRRARRYLLRIQRDGTARVTIPRGGSMTEARDFASQNLSWIRQQLRIRATRPGGTVWAVGTKILFHGQPTPLDVGPPGTVQLGEHHVPVDDQPGDLRPAVERYLRHLAAKELPPRVLALAALHQLRVNRVTIRNQQSRWGSCSARGTISLNWRLIQTPDFVRDYLILHELAHLRQMNHSQRFWQEVAKLCPEFSLAEDWIKGHSRLLM